jgi:hypothetical protein
MKEAPTENRNVEKTGAIKLRAENGYAIVEMEADGRWVELIREHMSGPFHHIIEPSGIREKTRPRTYNDRRGTYADDGLMP